MSDFESLIPKDPVELGVPYASEVCFMPGFTAITRSEVEDRTLRELNRAAEDLGMLGTSYFVDSGVAYRLPDNPTYDQDGKVTYEKCGNGLCFEGNLCTHAILKIHPIAGVERPVRALCLTFDDALLLPYFNKIDEDSMLYVPLLAVDDITKTD